MPFRTLDHIKGRERAFCIRKSDCQFDGRHLSGGLGLSYCERRPACCHQVLDRKETHFFIFSFQQGPLCSREKGAGRMVAVSIKKIKISKTNRHDSSDCLGMFTSILGHPCKHIFRTKAAVPTERSIVTDTRGVYQCIELPSNQDF